MFHNVAQEIQITSTRKPYEVAGATYVYCYFCDGLDWCQKVKDPQNPAMSAVACGGCRELQLLQIL